MLSDKDLLKLLRDHTPEQAEFDHGYWAGFEAGAYAGARAQYEALRPGMFRTCKGCGEVFEAWRKDQVYCTPRCRGNYNERKRYHKLKGAVDATSP